MPQTNGSLTSGHSSSNSSSEASEIKSSSKKENIICTEVFDEHSSPTKDGKIQHFTNTNTKKCAENFVLNF